MRTSVAARLASELGVAARVTLVERRTFSESDGSKRKIVIDNRR
jgi:hypothetical protein